MFVHLAGCVSPGFLIIPALCQSSEMFVGWVMHQEHPLEILFVKAITMMIANEYQVKAYTLFEDRVGICKGDDRNTSDDFGEAREAGNVAKECPGRSHEFLNGALHKILVKGVEHLQGSVSADEIYFYRRKEDGDSKIVKHTRDVKERGDMRRRNIQHDLTPNLRR